MCMCVCVSVSVVCNYDAYDRSDPFFAFIGSRFLALSQ